MNRSAEGFGPNHSSKVPVTGFFLAVDVKSVVAVTDAGREIPLFHYEAAFTLPADESADPACQQQRLALLQTSEGDFLRNMGCEGMRLRRINDPSLGTNCHGWVFLGGRVGVKDEHIETILRDNGYVPIEHPQSGDLAIYRDENKIVHSGVVVNSEASDGLDVESKWGPFSVFVHRANNYPRGLCAFYHSRRQGHALTIQRTSKE